LVFAIPFDHLPVNEGIPRFLHPYEQIRNPTVSASAQAVRRNLA
jgi:hypothetical protein